VRQQIWGEVVDFNVAFFSLSENVTVKTLLKSVHIYQSYCKKNLAQFFLAHPVDQKIVMLLSTISSNGNATIADSFIISLTSSFLRATACNAKRVFATAEASVRPSVCLSVTLLYCVKTTQLRITKSSLWATARTLVFLWQIFVPVGQGILLERGRQTRVPPVKSRHFYLYFFLILITGVSCWAVSDLASERLT